MGEFVDIQPLSVFEGGEGPHGKFVDGYVEPSGEAIYLDKSKITSFRRCHYKIQKLARIEKTTERFLIVFCISRDKIVKHTETRRDLFSIKVDGESFIISEQDAEKLKLFEVDCG